MKYWWVLAALAMPASAVNPPNLPCRLPDVGTEYRVLIQKRDQPDQIITTCSIEPRDPLEGPRRTLERLLKRKK